MNTVLDNTLRSDGTEGEGGRLSLHLPEIALAGGGDSRAILEGALKLAQGPTFYQLHGGGVQACE